MKSKSIFVICMMLLLTLVSPVQADSNEPLKQGWLYVDDSYKTDYSIDTPWYRNSWVYIDAHGELVKGEATIGGNDYFFDEHGIMFTGVLESDDG